MITIICITILAYAIAGKDINKQLDKLKGVDWKAKSSDVFGKIGNYAKKAGRVATKPLLQLYYVLTMGETTTLEKALIVGAILYTIMPFSLISVKAHKILGMLDEGLAVVYVIKKVQNKITPEIDAKVEETLNAWFGNQQAAQTVE
ncbi:MAG: DUF1232 domain-containing protein [Bacteroidales bacterium]|nr:DUF1232 domain-containing protein [Bacteroidales bacterium]